MWEKKTIKGKVFLLPAKPRLTVRIKRFVKRLPWIIYALSTLWLILEPTFTGLLVSSLLLIIAVLSHDKPSPKLMLIIALVTGTATILSGSLASIGASLHTLYMVMFYTGHSGGRRDLLVLGTLALVVAANLYPFSLSNSFNPDSGVIDLDWDEAGGMIAVGTSGTFGGRGGGGAAFLPVPVTLELSGFYVLDRGLEPVYQVPHYKYTTTSVSWSEDGNSLAVGTREGAIILVSNGTWGWRVLEGPYAKITDTGWCGNMLFYGDELGFLHRYDPSTGENASVQLSIALNSLACSWDGFKLVVSGGNGDIYLVDPATLDVLDTVSFGSPAMRVAWNPDGSRIAATLLDGRIVVIGVEDNRLSVETIIRERLPDLWTGTPRSIVWIGRDEFVVGSGTTIQVFKGSRLLWSGGDAGGIVSSLDYDGDGTLYFGTYLYTFQRTNGEVVSFPLKRLLEVSAMTSYAILVVSVLLLISYYRGTVRVKGVEPQHT